MHIKMTYLFVSLESFAILCINLEKSKQKTDEIRNTTISLEIWDLETRSKDTNSPLKVEMINAPERFSWTKFEHTLNWKAFVFQENFLRHKSQASVSTASK